MAGLLSLRQYKYLNYSSFTYIHDDDVKSYIYGIVNDIASNYVRRNEFSNGMTYLIF